MSEESAINQAAQELGALLKTKRQAKWEQIYLEKGQS